MNTQNALKTLPVMLGLGLAILVAWAVPAPQSGAQTLPLATLGSFDSPLPTPMAPTPGLPMPTPTPGPSQAAQAARTYLAQSHGIPVASLAVVTDHQTRYPNLGRPFQVVTLLDNRPTGRFYNLLVDLNDGRVIEDVASVWAAEEHARSEKHGKLQPALYERLQALRDDDVVTVMIWAAAGPGQSLPDREVAAREALAARYPEARAALERGGKPMDVDDPALARRIEAEYRERLDADMDQRVEPLVRMLEAQGVTAKTSRGLPAVTATLSKWTLLVLAREDSVGIIELAEGGQRLLLLDSAVPTNRGPAVWTRGYDGAGASIAVLEPDNVDFTSPDGSQCPNSSNNCFLHPGAVRWSPTGEAEHATLVASAAASNHPTARGMAPGATIISAGIQGPYRQEDIDALVWALDNGTDIVNASYAWCMGSASLDDIDRTFDHYARSRNRLLVVSAGNNDAQCPYDYVISPAKGWNVLSVGAYDDQNSSNWSDDSMASFSDWRNPDSPHHDHEKPEVVAPGVQITGVGLDGNLVTDPLENTGTSFAAPQVAGLAALLIHRNSGLRNWPEASRAIIMASAVHNIEGPSYIPTWQDLKDGAGGIDAALADRTATTRSESSTDPCTGPCWWGLGIDNTNFPVGAYLYRYFNTSRGERVRVAVAWWSKADCASMSSCNYDRLDTDLHMGAQYFDGSNWLWISGGWSASWDNNYELVEFTAPHTGQYRIAVYKTRADETSNYLGIAWVKDATYLPALRNKDGWASEILLRNEGLARTVTIHYFNADGSPTPRVLDSCILAPNQWCSLPVAAYDRIPAGTTGFAIIGGGEDVSAVVEEHDIWRYNNANGLAVGGLDRGWGQIGPAVHVPLAKVSYDGKFSHFYIVNAGGAYTSATVTSHFETGTQAGSPATCFLAPGARCDLMAPGPAGGRYASRVQASQPLGVIVAEESAGYPSTIYKVQNPFSAAASTVFVPQVKRNWGTPSEFTTIAVQNTSSTGTNVTVTYHADTGATCSHSASIGGNGFKVFEPALAQNCPASFVGAAVITSEQPVAVLVNEVGEKGYSGFLAGTRTVVLPHVQRDAIWWTGMRVMNVDGAAPTTGTLTLYNSGGSQNGQPYSFSIPNGHSSVNLGSQVPVGFVGSALLTADRPIVVSAIMSLYGNAQMTMMYNGLNR